MSYYCGWDGGGTKTEVYCMDDTGACIADECFGPLNFNGVPRERVEQTVRDSLAFMNSLPGGLNACKALTIGMAGASSLKATQDMNDLIRAGGFMGKLDVIGDHVIALAGAIRGAGAVLVAGTGAVCRARVIEICQSKCPGINIISPRHSPAYGAAMLAMENGR